MKVDFSKVVVTTLDEKPIGEVHKAIANTIYFNTRNLDLVEKAREINTGKEIEINEDEKKEIIELIKKHHPAFVAKSVIDFLGYGEDNTK